MVVRIAEGWRPPNRRPPAREPPTPTDALRASLWRTACDDAALEEPWLGKLLADLGKGLSVSRALLLGSEAEGFRCRRQWPEPAASGSSLSALEREAQLHLGTAEEALAWRSEVDGLEALGCALRPVGKLDGALLLLRDKGFSAREREVVGEAALALSQALARRRSLAALRQNESRFRIISELNAQIAFSMTLHPDGSRTVDWFTGAHHTPLGDTVSDPKVVFQRLSELCPEGRELARRLFARCQRNETVGGEFCFRPRAGDERWLRLDCVPVFSASEGRVTRIYGSVHDVTEERLSRLGMERERDQWHAIADLCPVGLAMLTLDGVLVDCNEVACALLGGQARTTLVGRPVSEFSEEPAATVEAIAQLRAGRAPLALRWVVQATNRQDAACEVFLRLLRDSEGKPSGIVAKLGEVRAQQAVLGTNLTSRLADLLSAVLGNAGLALAALGSSSPARSDLVAAIVAAESAAALLRPGPRAHPGRVKPRIAVIEHEDLLRRADCAALECEGYEALPFATLEEALPAFERGAAAPVAAVLEVRVPEKEAAAAVSALRALQADLPVVLTSVLARHSVAQGDARAVRLTKPYSSGQLVACLGPMLNQAPDSRPQAPGVRLQAPDSRPQAPGVRKPASR